MTTITCELTYAHKAHGDARRWYICSKPEGHRGRHVGPEIVRIGVRYDSVRLPDGTVEMRPK